MNNKTIEKYMKYFYLICGVIIVGILVLAIWKSYNVEKNCDRTMKGAEYIGRIESFTFDVSYYKEGEFTERRRVDTIVKTDRRTIIFQNEFNDLIVGKKLWIKQDFCGKKDLMFMEDKEKGYIISREGFFLGHDFW